MSNSSAAAPEGGQMEYVYDVGRSVPVEVLVGRTEQIHIGYVCVSTNASVMGLSLPTAKAESGLPVRPHRIGNMAYGLDYFHGDDAIRRMREKGWTFFYFDAGGNGWPIKITTKAFEQALRNLGLLSWPNWDKPVDDYVGTRGTRALGQIGVKTLGDAVLKYEEDLTGLPGVGDATVLAIEVGLEWWGLHLNGGNHLLYRTRAEGQL
jgi:hypothetical protein